MEGRVRITVYSEIIFQSLLARESVIQSNISLENYRSISEQFQKVNKDSNDVNGQIDEVQVSLAINNYFRNIHSFIIAHANISKLLHWSGTSNEEGFVFKGSRAEKDEIKNWLKSIRKNSKTFKKNFRSLRNHLEHFDERLISSAYANNVGSLRFTHSSKRKEYAIGQSEENYLRTVIHDESIYSIAGNDYQLKPMMDEITLLCRYIIKDEEFMFKKYEKYF